MGTIGLIAGIVAGLGGVGLIGWALLRLRQERALLQGEKNRLEVWERELQERQARVHLEAREEAERLRRELEQDYRERRNELQRLERRLTQKEDQLDRRLQEVMRREERLAQREREAERHLQEAERLKAEQMAALERVAGLTAAQAKEMLLRNLENEVRQEAAQKIRQIEEEAREEANRRARKIIAMAIERCAVDHVAETTVSVVHLASEELKGRIIGREGRNIRAFEAATGVDLIIDDTPEAVVISAFDPIRREIARIALERLLIDGRIHPARIEEVVSQARSEIEQRILEAGEQALLETGVTGLAPPLVRLLGKLQFRTSYGQNVLRHSIEVAYLAGLMAAELDANVVVAKRAGLLHDIGKAVDFEVNGPHALISMDLAKHHNEPPEVVHAIGAHHGDIEPETVEAILVLAADAISASRPGARRDTLEAYIQRLEKLERLADSFEGVEKAYAIQAGREIRVMVKPEVVDDAMATQLAREIARKIEQELAYPGQIKVTVIREHRAVEYAR